MSVIAGFYGKLPARGDFVRGALPRDFTDRWDAWLAPAIAGSRQSDGRGLAAAFLEAPVWRFALSRRVVRQSRGAGPDAAQRGPRRPLFPVDFRGAITTTALHPGMTRSGWMAAKPPAAPPWSRMPVRNNLGAMLGVPEAAGWRSGTNGNRDDAKHLVD